MAGRPAESAAGATTIAMLVAYVLGIRDPQHVAVMGAFIGLVPAGVTLLVSNGGIRGVLSRIWSGRRQDPPSTPEG